jgi:carboxypeptidase Q
MAAIGKVLEKLGIAPGRNNAGGGPDIRYLKEAGVPVVGLKQDGTDYFDLHHTADDTLDKITPDALKQNVAAYAALLYLVAETPAYFR